MEKLLTILAIVALAAGNPVNVTRTDEISLRMDGRIVGGEETTIEQAPYQVSLEKLRSNKLFTHACGGSIISKNWVVTAGHCVDSKILSNYQIRSGSTYVHQGAVHRVQKVVRHNNFESEGSIPVNDISLFRVVDADAFKFNDQRKAVPLFSGNVESLAGKNAIVTGWGTTDDIDEPSALRKVSVPVITAKSCNEAYEELYDRIPPGQVCAGLMKGGKDACQGDSGGPLVVSGQLVGIVSWGVGCGTPNYPGVYTDVSYYRQWVKTTSGV
ncbi:trypsin beta-like [Colletes gigas]|uniref:trypsin beta-like n=1 Tax=Colletes gigas TaxID=935657 RepID=UPI001C9B9DE4|nr:trypsin beta-like [Colletes gigas]